MPKLCDNVWFQNVGEPPAEFLSREVQGLPTRQYVHVCNPYHPHGLGDKTQEVTYAAMHRARAASERDGIRVELLGAVFPQDEIYGAQFFDRTFPLERSAIDIKPFDVARPLPLLFDVLFGAQNSEADYVVFTNVDICPVPHFYCSLDAMLARGYDSLAVNRRTLTGWPVDPNLVGLMALDQGRPHEGYDCFVFPREWMARFSRNKAVLGAAGVMQSLIYNLVANAKNMLFLGDVHLTWHLGDDKAWAAPHLRDYVEHNWTEAITTLHALASTSPRRFSDFCDNFRSSRVEVVENGGKVKLRCREGQLGFLPDLEAINQRA